MLLRVLALPVWPECDPAAPKKVLIGVETGATADPDIARLRLLDVP